MKIETAKNYQQRIKEATAHLNELFKAATVEGMCIEVDTQEISYMSAEHGCPVVLSCVKIKPSNIEV